jgi:hypothetical protein
MWVRQRSPDLVEGIAPELRLVEPRRKDKQININLPQPDNLNRLIVKPKGRIPPGLLKQEELREVKLKPSYSKKRKLIQREKKRRGRPRKRPQQQQQTTDIGQHAKQTATEQIGLQANKTAKHSGADALNRSDEPTATGALKTTISGRTIKPPNRD